MILDQSFDILDDALTGMKTTVWEWIMAAHRYYSRAYPILLIGTLIVGFLGGVLCTKNKKLRKIFIFGVGLFMSLMFTCIEYIIPHEYMKALAGTQGVTLSDIGSAFNSVFAYFNYLQAAVKPMCIPLIVFCEVVGWILQSFCKNHRETRRFIFEFIIIGVPLVLIVFTVGMPYLSSLFGTNNI